MSNKISILVIEDSETSRLLIELFWENDKTMQLNFCSDGKSAYKWLKKFLPDIILLDIMLPEIDGFQILEYLKSSEKYRHIPVIVYSACDGADDAKKALSIGAEMYINKPIGVNQFFQKVSPIIERMKLKKVS